ncbi:hypothetical protein B0H17DRAFT_1123748 [Mycena rosella]|uniref:Uncharacterized protein n=1 Tax=Mycena rosella TaxID=1033263 RepID=A0AAD7H3F1_MYCRO|nr:hypothetical protein B0H17DRAFT_1123748 [Mycena rosella]
MALAVKLQVRIGKWWQARTGSCLPSSPSPSPSSQKPIVSESAPTYTTSAIDIDTPSTCRVPHRVAQKSNALGASSLRVGQLQVRRRWPAILSAHIGVRKSPASASAAHNYLVIYLRARCPSPRLLPSYPALSCFYVLSDPSPPSPAIHPPPPHREFPSPSTQFQFQFQFQIDPHIVDLPPRSVRDYPISLFLKFFCSLKFFFDASAPDRSLPSLPDLLDLELLTNLELLIQL